MLFFGIIGKKERNAVTKLLEILEWGLCPFILAGRICLFSKKDDIRDLQSSINLTADSSKHQIKFR